MLRIRRAMHLQSSRQAARRGSSLLTHASRAHVQPVAGAARLRKASRSSSHRAPMSVPDTWVYRAPATPEVIEELSEGYKTIGYPMLVTLSMQSPLIDRFPLFHWPSFVKDLNGKRYMTDRGFYVVVMAVCAIVSSRLLHGARLPTSPSHHDTYPASEVFYQLALDAFPHNLSTATAFNYKRAKALLAIASVQYGNAAELHTQLGDYGTLTWNDGFYDESRWAPGLREPEIQERRRLVSYMQYIQDGSAYGSSGPSIPWKFSPPRPGEVWSDTGNLSRTFCIPQKYATTRISPTLVVEYALRKSHSCTDGISWWTCTRFSNI